MTKRVLQYLVAFFFLVSATCVTAFAAAPFYENLLFKGKTSYKLGKTSEAAETLSLACFGFLDEPNDLAGCLVYLSLAQNAAGEKKEFERTFGRIVEVEQRFGAYTAAEIPTDIRANFYAAATKSIPEPVLVEAKLFVEKSKE